LAAGQLKVVPSRTKTLILGGIMSETETSVHGLGVVHVLHPHAFLGDLALDGLTERLLQCGRCRRGDNPPVCLLAVRMPDAAGI